MQFLLGLLNQGQPDTWQGRIGDAILTAQEEVESFRQDFQEHSKGNTIRPLDLRSLVWVHSHPFGKRNRFMLQIVLYTQCIILIVLHHNTIQSVTIIGFEMFSNAFH